MNLRKLNALLKPYKMHTSKGKFIYIEFEPGTKYYGESTLGDSEFIITFDNLQAESCCGAEEIGGIEFHEKWKELPQKIINEIIRYTFPESKRFQIIYSLELNEYWEKFNEALSATGWIPLKRWKGNGRNIIQAWCR